jgi:hypothetical protein
MIGTIAAGLYGVGVPPSTNSYESIATATPAGNNTVTFSSISSGYKHLQVRYIARSSFSATGLSSIDVQFNGANTNYAYHRIYGNGSSPGADSAISQSSGFIASATMANNVANSFAGGVIDILDYGSTSKAKTVRALHGGDNNGSGGINLNSVLWFATPAAITSITFLLGAGETFATNSQFALYGIKD